MRNKRLRRFTPLTDGERRAATLSVDGYPLPAIAVVLGVGESTVRRWLANVRYKFGTSQQLAIRMKLNGELPEFED